MSLEIEEKKRKKVVTNTGESFKVKNSTISILNYSINNLDKIDSIYLIHFEPNFTHGLKIKNINIFLRS